MTNFVVLVDANILFSRTLRDYILYAADAGSIEVRWSQEILDEMSRNLQENLGIAGVDAARLELLMNDFIEYALVDVHPEALATVEGVEMDANDRHVLAAAITAGADVLLTENTRHFPREWMAEHGIELLSAEQLLIRLVDQHPDSVRTAHEKTVRYSPKPEVEVLATLEALVGNAVVAGIRRIADLE